MVESGLRDEIFPVEHVRNTVAKARLAWKVFRAQDNLQTDYFERWVNALVYELFFPESLHSAGLDFFRIAETAKLRSLSSIKKRQDLTELTAIFQLANEIRTHRRPLESPGVSRSSPCRPPYIRKS